MSVEAHVLVAGAINTDLVATMARAPDAGETITGASFSIHGGGKGANQAVAAARSGVTVFLVGSVGDDDFGKARITDLQRDGIHVEWVRVSSEAASGVALIFVEVSAENRIAYVPGATLTTPPDHAAAALGAVRPSYVLATNELPNETLRALFEGAKSSGILVALNATPDPQTVRDMLEFVSILIVNEGEAAVLLGVDKLPDAGAAVSQLRTLGIETVVITAGKDGAFVGTGSGVTHHRAPEVAVVDTTGAGDAFCGAFLAQLASGTLLDNATRFAIHASALSVTRKGAQSSIPVEGDVGVSMAAEGRSQGSRSA